MDTWDVIGWIDDAIQCAHADANQPETGAESKSFVPSDLCL
jgi:hypothetical protein